MKLTREEISKLEPKPFNPKPSRFWSLDDLAKGRMFSQNAIKKSIQYANERRQEHRFGGWRGWTKNKRMRSEVRIPVSLFLQPEIQKKYFPENADPKEQAKALERFKRDYPAFVTHD